MATTQTDAVGMETMPATPLDLPSRWHSLSDSLRVAVDSVIATLILVLLTPVLLVIALAIKLSGGGPVFYVQERIGRGGGLFPFVKFRTMVQGADKMRSEVLGTPDDEMPDRYRRDPRITPVGQVLRRWSLDELPQLVNVARGEMALVGPRPILPEESVLVDERSEERHRCRPGLTGLWQVSGRKETSWDERMDLDLEYVRTQSFGNDLKIIARTFAVVLRGDGAF